MPDFWHPVSAEFATVANRLTKQTFKFVEQIEVSKINKLTPNKARLYFESLADEFLASWAVVSSSRAAQVAYGAPHHWPIGGLLEAEAVIGNQISLRLKPSDDGALTLWAFGSDLSALADSDEQWAMCPPMKGLLKQTKSFIGVRKGTTLSYDVYWQHAGDFGLRERLALLASLRG